MVFHLKPLGLSDRYFFSVKDFMRFKILPNSIYKSYTFRPKHICISILVSLIVGLTLHGHHHTVVIFKVDLHLHTFISNLYLSTLDRYF